jgi:predicted Fe-Mo cluster-binding NifX family protein
MKIVVTSTGSDLDSVFSPIFGRCNHFIFFADDAQGFEAIRNNAAEASGGAGIQAARLVVDHGAEAIVTGRVGPKASDVLKAANIPVYLFHGDTVREAVEAFKAGKLQEESF